MAEPLIEDDRTGMTAQVLRRAFLDNLVSLQAKSQITATPLDRFFAMAYTARDRLFHRWIDTHAANYVKDARRVYYLSAEYLIGRLLMSNLLSLGIADEARAAASALGLSLDDVVEQEVDAGLGNGGLGRLAACFLDSMATLGIPAVGYGLRYEFGIFRQVLTHGHQVELPDEWLRFGNPWEIPRPEYAVVVGFGGKTEYTDDRHGGFRVKWHCAEHVVGVPYDTPVAGYKNDVVNTMRLWRARAGNELDLATFNAGDYFRATLAKNASETISKVLYPNDHSPQGKELRLRQQYFFVACSIADILRRYQYTSRDFSALPDKIALQLNDTHPAIAIVELMRVLVDDHHVEWAKAWDLTVRSCAYTNHTLMAEALERWPVALFERLLPRHLEIIHEINRRFLDDVGDDTLRRTLSLIEEGPHGAKQVRMGHLAVIGSHSVNGVAELHSELLRRDLFPEMHARFPGRFGNKTNGVTPRRWLLEANRGLAGAITEAIGDGWVTDLDQLRRLDPLAEDAAWRDRLAAIKRQNKDALAQLVQREAGVAIDPAALLDVQVKRIHEYKRQLLCALHAASMIVRLRAGLDVGPPRTILFAGKAAPGYLAAKRIIRLCTGLSEVTQKDPRVRDRLQVVFVPNYRVSSAQVIIPAAELSEQISTAGYEASGTGNMKLAMNGALTIGTLDGANIEIRREVGPENFFLFGLTADEVIARRGGYAPAAEIARTPLLAETVAWMRSGELLGDDPGLVDAVVRSLVEDDRYLCCADFGAYVAAQGEVGRAYQDRLRWQRMSAHNIARMGAFSSDRTIREYARDIWRV